MRKPPPKPPAKAAPKGKAGTKPIGGGVKGAKAKKR